MSVEERIRKAEERYNQENGAVVRLENKENYERKFNNNNNHTRKMKKSKLIMQIFVCLVIYVVFYAVTNRDYVFSDSFKNDVNIFFTEKTKIYQIYSDAKSYVKNNIMKSGDDTGEAEENANEDGVEENTSGDGTGETEENTSEDSIGGAEENISEDTEESQMDKDAREIKSSISFINPIEGTITSTFGWRNPTVSTVPKYHTGLDIAAVSGTVIKSATDGKVTLVSSEGDYGNHYQIQIADDVVIIYAHCKTLYLQEGDTVVQGQEIAEVGSTGNSTGPHLHFEIRKEDRLVDPQLILDI
jgi:murein DD-endopeptidase MepM/ murein hydrolase activator NlpD